MVASGGFLGAADPRCAVFITMGKKRPEARALAAKHGAGARDTPGIKIIRPLNVFGYDDAPRPRGDDV